MLTEIPLHEICADDTFNCRGTIIPFDVRDLADDIKEQGLIQPIVVQPWSSIPGYKYRVVVGHRRYMAFQLNKEDTIPCIIKEGLDEQHAMALNLSENIQRKALNIYQEAKAVEKFRLRGLTVAQVAELLSVSSGWVQIREYLLQLPYEVQMEAAAGFLTQPQIKELYGFKDNREMLFETVRNIKNHKQRGEKGAFRIKKEIKFKKEKKKLRSNPTEIFKMQEIITNVIGFNLATRSLAWCAGMITTGELYDSIKEEAEKQGKIWEPIDDE